MSILNQQWRLNLKGHAQAHMSSRDDLKWSVKSVRLIEEFEMLLPSPSQNHSHSEGNSPLPTESVKMIVDMVLQSQKQYI